MRRLALGDTGLEVTPLGLGLAALGRPGYINLAHGDDFSSGADAAGAARHCERMLDLARSIGIAYIDAARSYGHAERMLADWLSSRAIEPTQITVGSKWGYTYTADWRVDAPVHEVKDHRRAALARQFPESSALLGRHLRLYQVHSATLESGVLDDGATLEELALLRDRCGIAVGLTTSGPRQAETIRRALDIESGGRRLFTTVQSTWNPLEPSAASALAEAHAAGVGVIVKEALANGRLTERDPALAAGIGARLVEAVPGANSIDQAALALAIAQPFVDVVLSGATTPSQLRSNARAVELSVKADPAVVGTFRPESPESYWSARAALPWN